MESILPMTYKLKQSLLFAKEKNPALLADWGRKLAAAGWLYDAIDFFAAAKDRAGLTELRARIRAEGDVFLFKRCLAEVQETAAEGEWGELGQRAFSLGKLQYALEAFRLAGDRKRLDEVELLIHPPPPEPPPDPGSQGPPQTPPTA